MEIEKKKVNVDELSLGMYVTELDRPWLDTPFLLQGFLIRDEEDLRQLRDCCDYVFIDVEKSQATPSQVQKPPPQEKENIFAVRMAPAMSKPVAREQDTKVFIQDIKEASKVYHEAHVYITSLLEDVRLGRSINVEGTRQLVSKMADSIVENENALVWLTQLKRKDEYTSQHCINVCVISLLLGRHLGISGEQLRELGFGALLHDIGKMRVPLEVLNKEMRPTPEEMEILKKHPDYGYEALKNQEGIPQSTLDIVYSHHERIDGSGYPQGIEGDTISFFTMVVSIADVYDAVTSDRVYHLGISPHEAMSLMYETGPKSFRKDLLEHFIQCLGIYPIGSIVEMSSGEVGIVMTVNRARNLKPIVTLVLDAEKKQLDKKVLVNLELMAQQNSTLTIKKILESGAHGINVRELLAAEAGLSGVDL